MYPEEVTRRIMSGERNDRNATGEWLMCPVCGRGDDDDADPTEWADGCPSCNPMYETRDGGIGYEMYPSIDRTDPDQRDPVK